MSKADEYLEEAADDRSQLFDTSPETNRLRNNERHRELCTAAIVEAIREVVQEFKADRLEVEKQYQDLFEYANRKLRPLVAENATTAKTTGLSFWEAMQAVADGKKVRRVEWRKGNLIKASAYGTVVWEDGSTGAFMTSWILATDWEVVE